VWVHFIHIANVIYLLSYAVKNMLALRILTILGLLSLFPYFLALHLYAPVMWNVVFLTINLVRLWQLRHEDKARIQNP